MTAETAAPIAATWTRVRSTREWVAKLNATSAAIGDEVTVSSRDGRTTTGPIAHVWVEDGALVAIVLDRAGWQGRGSIEGTLAQARAARGAGPVSL